MLLASGMAKHQHFAVIALRDRQARLAILRPVWSVSDRGTAGPLDRVAQIAERKYRRPHARPFRLRFARVIAVVSACHPPELRSRPPGIGCTSPRTSISGSRLEPVAGGSSLTQSAHSVRQVLTAYTSDTSDFDLQCTSRPTYDRPHSSHNIISCDFSHAFAVEFARIPTPARRTGNRRI
jgi:hypothetical protein